MLLEGLGQRVGRAQDSLARALPGPSETAPATTCAYPSMPFSRSYLFGVPHPRDEHIHQLGVIVAGLAQLVGPNDPLEMRPPRGGHLPGPDLLNGAKGLSQASDNQVDLAHCGPAIENFAEQHLASAPIPTNCASCRSIISKIRQSRFCPSYR